MTDEEIIAARITYERALWTAFGETLLRIPDMTAARQAYNERTAPLRAALPDEVRDAVEPRQR
jgi:hypothetical protein